MKKYADNLKIVAALILLGLVGWYFLGQRNYETVGSKAYEVAKALYSTCNLRDAERLQQVSQQIDRLEKTADLSADEAATLRSLTLLAERGDWKQAASESRRLMQAQLVYP